MEENMPKKIFAQELEGMRQRGRPRKGLKEEAVRDFQVLGARRLRKLVMDRKNGRILFDRVKRTTGCSANERKRSNPCFTWNSNQAHFLIMVNLQKFIYNMKLNLSRFVIIESFQYPWEELRWPWSWGMTLYRLICYQWTCWPHLNGSRIMSKSLLGYTVELQGKKSTRTIG